MAQSIATNTAIALGGRVIQAGLGLLLVSLTSRFLGEAAFGTYSALLAYGSLLLIGADFGLYLTLTREAGHEPETMPSILSDITWLRLGGLTLVWIIGSIILLYIPSLASFRVAFWLVAAGLSAQSISQLMMGVFQARSVVWRATTGDIVGRLVQIILTMIVIMQIFRVESVLGIVIAFTGATIAATAVHYLLLPFPWRLKSPPVWVKARYIISQSWPAAAMLLLNAIYFRIDLVMLSALRPAAEVGLYGLAYRIIESALFIPAMFGGLLLPRFSSKIFPRDLFQESLIATFWAATGLCVIIVLLARPIIALVSGTAFSGAASLLMILSLALFAMFFGNLFGFTLVARGRQKSLMWLYLGLVVFNIVSNYLFIPHFGAAAAAWTTVATEIMAASVAGYLVWRIVPYRLSLNFKFTSLFTKS